MEKKNKIIVITGAAGFIGYSLFKEHLKNINPDEIYDFILYDKVDDEIFLPKVKNDQTLNDLLLVDKLIVSKLDNVTVKYFKVNLIQPYSILGDCLISELISIKEEDQILIHHCASPIGVELHDKKDLFEEAMCINHSIKKMIEEIKKITKNITLNFMSSSEIYGNLIIDENPEVIKFIDNKDYNYFNRYLNFNFRGVRSSYVRQKHSTELLFLSIPDINLNIFRLFNIIGYEQSYPNGVIPIIFNDFFNKQHVLVDSSGLRTYTRVEFAVKTILKESSLSNGIKLHNVVEVHNILNCNDIVDVFLDNVVEVTEKRELPFIHLINDKENNKFINEVLDKNLKFAENTFIQVDFIFRDKKYTRNIFKVSKENTVQQRQIGLIHSSKKNLILSSKKKIKKYIADIFKDKAKGVN